jgi:hypothetical protein
MSLKDMEEQQLMQQWQDFNAAQGFPPDGVSQAEAVVLAEGQRQLDAWELRDAILMRHSRQSSRW